MDIPGRAGRRLRVRKVAITCLLAAFLFSACGQAAVQPGGTLTPAITPSLTETVTHGSITPILEYPTNLPTQTLDPTAAIEATAIARYTTEVAPFIGNCPGGADISQHLSPDGNWTFCNHGTDLIIANINSTKWIFSYQEFFGSGFVGFTNLVHWSQDGRYLYFAPMAYIDAIDPLPWNALALLRMDLSNGEVYTILPGKFPDEETFYTVSISPTGRRLVYTNALVSNLIHILDLTDGGEKTITIDEAYGYIGSFRWSDDGTLLSVKVDAEKNQNYYYLTYNVIDLSFVKSEIIP